MKYFQIISGILAVLMFTGCASMEGAQGPGGPKLIGSGRATESGHYTEVGVEFSSVGDFIALVSPSRWKAPIRTGGSLSWINPSAWGEDPGRTSRILLGEVVMVGTVAAASSSGGGGDSTQNNSTTGTGPTGPESPYTPPSYTPE